MAGAATTTDTTPLPQMLLTTKLYIPPARPSLVPRPHLVNRLNNALKLGHKLSLISAGPGFGKTTLLSEWIHQQNATTEIELESAGNVLHPSSFILHPSRIAWVSLDDDDNNGHRFLAYCVSALQTIHPGVGQKTIALTLEANFQQLTPEHLVTTLINEAAPITQPFIFVLDDYHVINNPLIHNSLTYLLDNLPPQVHLVMATRTEPPLPLARWRGRGQLTEIGANDLRFTPPEIAAFLNQVMGLNLSAAEVSALEDRTEGWVAGLQMAALSMQGVKDTAGFVQAFTGSHRYILDYLLEEVLNRQTEAVQDFLLQSSVLNRLCGPLCDAVLDRPDLELKPNDGPGTSHTILASLDQANLFIIPLDDERYWYRYHHLFADLLRHRLKQTKSAAAIAALHRRAADWYEQNGFLVEAMSHALAAVDVERVVRLAQQKAATMLSRSELVTLLSWLDALPRAMDRSRPYLSLLHAWAMLLTGELQAVETHLAEAESEFASTGEADHQRNRLLGEIATLRGGVAYFQRDMARSIELYRQALDYLPPDNLFMRGIVWQCLGAAYSWCGHVTGATRAFEQAETISQTTGNLLVMLIATWNLAQLYQEQGQLRQAAHIYRQALDFVDRQSEPNRHMLRPLTGRLHIGLAELQLQWNDLEAAARQAQAGLDLGRQENESGALTAGYLALAQIEHARGDEAAALDALHKARNAARRYTGPRYLIHQVAIFQAWLWLAQDNLRSVAHWLHTTELSLSPLPESIPYLAEGEYLTGARLLIAQHHQPVDDELPLRIDSPLDTALEIATKIYTSAQSANRVERMIECLTLQALCFQAQNNNQQALAALEEALILAEPNGYVRIFVNENGLLADLLRRLKARNIAPKYIGELLAAFKSLPAKDASPQPLLDPLSERELEILHLIAGGMSNKELAEKLVVTVGTAKWHLNNIYSKLDVRSRTQAVARARELGLL